MDYGLSRCHGTIRVCTEKKSIIEMEELKDGIELQPKLDFFSAYSNYRTDGTADSILRLQSAEELFIGILQCDGIVVFDTKGSLIAYRVFYRTNQSDSYGSSAPVGGARRRAFEGTKAMVCGILKSSLFRSQDGLTIREGGQ
jgi:hypothetical protein